MSAEGQFTKGGRLTTGAGFLLDALRARPVARLVMSGMSVILALVGVGMLGYPFATNVYQGRIQERLEREIAAPELQRAYTEGELASGDPLTRIQIPAIGVDTIVVQGTGQSALKAGAGHYVNTPLPGEEGNVAIAGHRTTFGKPFADLDKLKPGQEVILKTPVGTYTYKISKDPFVVDDSDFTVISQTPGHTLTLTSCHPKGSARQRIVVKAEMIQPTTGA